MTAREIHKKTRKLENSKTRDSYILISVLFTFDNHDPRGDCVLLNDGTVMFIRTEEELNALRWSE